MGKYPYRDFRVLKYILYTTSHRNDRALVMLTSPKIKVVIRRLLNLPTPRINPRVQAVNPLHHLNQQVIPVLPRQHTGRSQILTTLIELVPLVDKLGQTFDVLEGTQDLTLSKIKIASKIAQGVNSNPQRA